MALTTGLAAGLCNFNALATDFKKFPTFSSGHSGHSGHLSLNVNVVSKPLVYSSAHQRSRSNCRTIRVYSLFGGKKAKKESSQAGIIGNKQNLHKTLRKRKIDTKDDAMEVLKELAETKFTGYSRDKLVKATVSGRQEPVRIEITRDAIELGPEKLSLLIRQAYKVALRKSAEVMKETVNEVVMRVPSILPDIVAHS